MRAFSAPGTTASSRPGGQKVTNVLTLKRQGEKVTGTCSNDGAVSVIRDGKVERDGTVSFVYTHLTDGEFIIYQCLARPQGKILKVREAMMRGGQVRLVSELEFRTTLRKSMSHQNGSSAAPRPFRGTRPDDAERRGRRSHAERGNEGWLALAPSSDVDSFPAIAMMPVMQKTGGRRAQRASAPPQRSRRTAHGLRPDPPRPVARPAPAPRRRRPDPRPLRLGRRRADQPGSASPASAGRQPRASPRRCRQRGDDAGRARGRGPARWGRCR